MEDNNQFFEDILHELSFRSSEGYPDFSKPQHITLLSEILTEWGLSDVKFELMKNLLKEDEEKPLDAKEKEKAKQLKLVWKGKGYGKEGEEGITYKNVDGKLTKIDKDGEESKEDSKTKVSGADDFQHAPDIKKKEKTDNKASKPRTIAGKNKTLNKVDSVETNEFKRDLEPDDTEFNQRNEKIANPKPPEAYKLPTDILENPKFPKKYLKALERMVNTKPTGDGTKWTHYSDIPGGAGQISAQAGELMTMMGVSMSDDEFDKFTESLLKHEESLIEANPDLKKEAKRIVTKSWINSARNNRKAISNRIKNEYPNSEVIATSWDTKDDVESLGLQDYNTNKGFSTDMYIKIKTSDGEEILDEVSLKKSTEVNFLNSSAGKFIEWDENIPEDINPTVYRDTQRESLVSTGQSLTPDIDKFLSSGSESAVKLRKLFESKKITFAEALEETKNGKGSRGKSKVILETIKALAEDGNDIAKKHLEDVQTKHRGFQKKAITAITENPKMKAGMLSEIRSEFPLKAVSEGEETMAIGANSLDKAVMKNIFGTDNFDEIKEKLEAQPGPPPFLGYRAEVGSEVIPLAEIRVREDGVGYGGSIKFEMTLDKRFAKVLVKANSEVYSEN